MGFIIVTDNYAQFSCPSCGFEDVTKISVIYQQGIVKSETVGDISGRESNFTTVTQSSLSGQMVIKKDAI